MSFFTVSSIGSRLAESFNFVFSEPVKDCLLGKVAAIWDSAILAFANLDPPRQAAVAIVGVVCLSSAVLVCTRRKDFCLSFFILIAAVALISKRSGV
jgi:hypothetical protein